MTFLLDKNSRRSDSQVNTLAVIHLYPSTQITALGPNSPSDATLEEDRIYYGCAIIPFGSGDFLVVHGVAYNSRFTKNLFVMHSLLLLSGIRLVGNSLQFQNGHTYGVSPFESVHMVGIRYDASLFPRVKTLKVTRGEPALRGPDVIPWPTDSPLNLDTLPVTFSEMPPHVQHTITQSCFAWKESEIDSTVIAVTAAWSHVCRHSESNIHLICLHPIRPPWKAWRPTSVRIYRTTNRVYFPCQLHRENTLGSICASEIGRAHV